MKAAMFALPGRIVLGERPVLKVGPLEALSTQATLENYLRRPHPGGVFSSLGVYFGKLPLPLDAFAARLDNHAVATTSCPGGKERMSTLMDVLASARAEMRPLVVHRFPLDKIEEAYNLVANQCDGVLKVAITP